jgi:alkylhydroperoxidase family enzyme
MSISLVVLIGCSQIETGVSAANSETPAVASATSVNELLKAAKARVNSQAWGILEAADSAVLKGVDTREAPSNGRTLNSVRAAARVPRLAKPFAHLYRSVLFEGGLPRATKLGMAMRVAQIVRSPYTVAHLERMLRNTEGGQEILGRVANGGGDFSAQQESALNSALDYADWLTRDIAGVTDARFRKVRVNYTDAQIVELTITVAAFNFYTRFVEALHVPVEAWVFDTNPVLPPPAPLPRTGRVSLINDATITWASAVRPNPFNSARAMYLVPDLAEAWGGVLGGIQKDSAVGSEILRQTSFAVSTSNGCRYCSMHQVRFLKDMGVSPAKLLAMQKDDSALTPKELIAVQVARKITRDPGSVTSGDWEKLKSEFGEGGAIEVVSYACAFNFMNRFTDNLGLPPEDEAVKAYHDVYHSDFQKKSTTKP